MLGDEFCPATKKIVNGGGNFVRYAVAESAAYLAYVSIYDASKVQNLPARTIFIKKDRHSAECLSFSMKSSDYFFLS